MTAPEPRKWLLDKRDTDEYGSVLDYHLDFEIVLQLIDEYSRISGTHARSCEARRGVGGAVESNTVDEKRCSRLASRVEELEKGLREIVKPRGEFCHICGGGKAGYSGHAVKNAQRCPVEIAEKLLAGAHAEEKF